MELTLVARDYHLHEPGNDQGKFPAWEIGWEANLVEQAGYIGWFLVWPPHGQPHLGLTGQVLGKGAQSLQQIHWTRD